MSVNRAFRPSEHIVNAGLVLLAILLIIFGIRTLGKR